MTDQEGPEGDNSKDLPEPSDDDRVGYCRPPKGSRFRPGQSGNPRGRPTGSKGLGADLKAELGALATVTMVDGKRKRLPVRRWILKALAGKAAAGDVRAADKILSYVIQFEGFEDQRSSRRGLSETDEMLLRNFLAEPDNDQSEAADGALPQDSADEKGPDNDDKGESA